MKIKSRTAIKTLILVAFVFIAYLLQAMLFARMSIFGAKPLALPLAVAAIAMAEGSVRGGAFGVLAGVLCDLSFNQPAITFTIGLAIVGIGIGLMAENFLVKNFASYLLCTLIALMFCAAWQSMSFLIFDNVAAAPLLAISVRQTLASLLFTPPVYLLLHVMDRLAA